MRRANIEIRIPNEAQTVENGPHSNKLTNNNVRRMYRDSKEPFIETTIVIRTPVNGTPLGNAAYMNLLEIPRYLEELNHQVQEDIGNTFESDVVSVKSHLKKPLGLAYDERLEID